MNDSAVNVVRSGNLVSSISAISVPLSAMDSLQEELCSRMRSAGVRCMGVHSVDGAPLDAAWGFPVCPDGTTASDDFFLLSRANASSLRCLTDTLPSVFMLADEAVTGNPFADPQAAEPKMLFLCDNDISNELLAIMILLLLSYLDMSIAVTSTDSWSS